MSPADLEEDPRWFNRGLAAMQAEADARPHIEARARREAEISARRADRAAKRAQWSEAAG